MKPQSVLIIGCLLLSGTCFAHEDRIIVLTGNGALSGIPAEYGPANLHVQYATPGSDGASILSLDLTLGKNQTHIPICVTGLIQTRSSKEIRASASWYGDESVVPYYLEINFPDPSQDESTWASPGYSLLFNLHTGKLMQMNVTIARDGGKSIQEVPVDIIDRCGVDEAKNFYHRAK
jgi:hypothetical protein